MKTFLLALALATIALIPLIAQELPNESEDKTLSPYFFINSDDPTLDKLPLYSTTAEVSIAGVIADVTVKQVYKNTGKKPIEAIYVFPASTRAAVYGMTMKIGDRLLIAEIQKREEARRTYERARSEGRSASLLEQQKPNVFQMNVANIMPGDTITVELKYTELLIPTDGVYEFVYPTVVGPRYSNKNADSAKESEKYVETPYLHEGEKPTYIFDIDVDLTTGVPVEELKCTSHKVVSNNLSPSDINIKLDESEKDAGNKDFILKYRLTGGKIETGLLLSEGTKENYFLLMLQPPKRVESTQIVKREFIFIVDVSGSMNGYPLNTSKAVMKNLLNGLNPAEKFNVLLFAGSSQFLSTNSLEATQDNIKKGFDLIDNQSGGGGTEFLSALKRVYEYPKEKGYSRTIVIITDGYIDVEEEAFEMIRNNLNQANVFAFGIGNGVNRYLIEGVALTGCGEPFIVRKPEEAESTSEKFRKYIQSPVMTDIKIEYNGFLAYDVEPVSIPDVLAERPIIIYGKWMGTPTGSINVYGTTGETRYKVDVEVPKFGIMESNQALKYLWARKKIELLADYNSIRQQEKYKNEITDLGLEYNLLTQFTSFVAVDYLVRNKDSVVKVNQPLPLPEGVSDYAVGERVYSVGKMSYSKTMGAVPADGRGMDNPLEPKQKPEPQVNLAELQKNVVYPELAKLFGIEGKVIVKALVDKKGNISKTEIIDSDSKLLNKAAEDAIAKTTFTPAKQNRKPVEAWAAIPIQFKLDGGGIAMKKMTSGLKFFDLKIGEGKAASKGSEVTIHYKGYLSDGTLFEETTITGELLTYKIGDSKVIRALQEGVLAMKAGGTRLIITPPDLAYGSAGFKDKVPPNETLYYEVEMIRIN